MASGGERRLVFDTRGRRKHVIRVVYAILALLMGGSLFLVVGPVNITQLIGGSSSSSPGAVLDEQAERIEQRLAKDPTDEALLLSLTRTRIAAGNAQLEISPETGAPIVTTEGAREFEQGLHAWHRYLKLSGAEPNSSAAQLVAGTYFSLAQSSATLGEAESNIANAAAAERIFAEQRPNVGSLSTLATYQYFAGDFAAGDKSTKQAAQLAPSKGEAKAVEKQLAEYRKRGKAFEQQKKKFAKLEKERGKESLQNPFGGLSGGTGSSVAP
jgi:hypothetical protein